METTNYFRNLRRPDEPFFFADGDTRSMFSALTRAKTAKKRRGAGRCGPNQVVVFKLTEDVWKADRNIREIGDAPLAEVSADLDD
jgi:hypothetical protein